MNIIIAIVAWLERSAIHTLQRFLFGYARFLVGAKLVFAPRGAGCILDRVRFLPYDEGMHKQVISVSLDPSNVLWLRAQAVSSGCRSISAILDRLVREARTGGSRQAESVRSVVGTVKIGESDSDLSTADAAVRALFPLTPNRQSTQQRRMARPSKGGRSSVSKGRKRG